MRLIHSFLCLLGTLPLALLLAGCPETPETTETRLPVVETASHPLPLSEQPATWTPPATTLPCQQDALATAHAWLHALVATDTRRLQNLTAHAPPRSPSRHPTGFAVQSVEPAGDTFLVFASLQFEDQWGPFHEAILLELIRHEDSWYVRG